MHMEFLAENLAIIICAIIGIGLMVVEVFMPGFGVPGIAGFGLLLASVYLAWTRHGLLPALAVAAVEIGLVGVAIALALRSTSRGKLSRSPLILKGAQSRDQGFIAVEELGRFLGRQGVVLTTLRPAGMIDIEGERLNVVSAGEFIEKGATVVVKEVEGGRVLVEEGEAHV